MCFAKTMILALSVILAQRPAACIEPSVAVKASTILKTETSWNGKPVVYPTGKAEITAMSIEISPGGETGWHLHQVPSLAFVLEGELEVRLSTGETRRISPGEALAEVVDTLHNGRVIGTRPVKLVVFYLGAPEKRLTVKADPPAPAKP